ncbi:MAG: TonB-dependent receptor, partial [Vagococcus sp.]|nr:TonB-dependent receptor [Vagococcus sp.]
MKQIITTLIIAFFCCVQLSAQSISGKVTDSQNQPIEFANVALYSLPDSALVTGTITNQEGEFSLECKETKDAFLKISFIGYQTQIAPPTSGQTIVMKDDSNLLDEVVVRSNLPRIEIKNDALITTIQNTVLSKAGTGNDVLKRLPSLTGDNGVFSVFGKGEAKIYINNREMRNVSELDNLNSADIRNVEIINNPGARYDATVKAVIRINTVRKAGDGFGFDVRSSYYQSQNTDLREQLNINYRKKGLDLFGTIGFNQNQWLQDSKLFQKTYVDTLWTQDNTLYNHGDKKTWMGIAGFNYEISPKHYIGTKYTLMAFPDAKSFSTLNSTVFADNLFYDKWSNEEATITQTHPTHNINTYYNGTFGKLNVNFNADYYTSGSFAKSTAKETSQENEDRIVNTESDVENRLIASKLVLSYPVFGGWLSVGNEYTKTRRNDVYKNIENYVASSASSIHERNNSLFAEYAHKTPIGQMTAGLRYENVNSEYFIDGKKENEQSRRYAQWFPSASLTSKIKNVGLYLSYSAKTVRPNYRQLSNNIYYLNRFTLQGGNPYLKPTVNHDVTFVGSWRFVQAIVSYQKLTNAIIHWSSQLPENQVVSLIKYQNLDKMSTLNAYLTLSPTFGVWQPQLTTGIAKQWMTVISQNRPFHLNNIVPFVKFNNSLRLPKGVLLTLDSRFQGKGDFQNVRLTENQFIVSVGLSKSFLNDQLNLSLKG